MKSRRLTTTLFVGLLACAAGVGWWTSLESNWAINPDRPLVDPPAVPKGAVPVLESAAPLPSAAGGLYAKPVIATDSERRIVIAQSLGTGLNSGFVQWTQVGQGPWSEPVVIPNWPESATFLGDPWVETDRRGHYYFVHTGLPTGGLTFRRSNDSGQTWSRPRELAQGTDRPVLGISPNGKHLIIAASQGSLSSAAPGGPQTVDQVLAHSQIVFTTSIWESHNYGQTWTSLPAPLPSTHAIPFSVVVNDQGLMASSWIAVRSDPFLMGRPVVGGKPNSYSVVCWTRIGDQRSTQRELVQDLQPDRQHPFNGERLPVLAMGDTGTLHVAYVDMYVDVLGLYVLKCDWGSWSKPLRLSSETADEVRLPAIATMGSMVHVTWLERRDNLWQAYYRGSRDGGESWSDKLLLSVPHPSSSMIDKNGLTITSDDDQTSLRDDGAGTIHAVWAVKESQQSRNGEVWHARIRWQRPKL